eukprot:550469-Heterocapsa_arctica.AAC.1
MKGGMLFYRSKNGVLLTEGLEGTVDPQYIIKVCELHTALVLYTGAPVLAMAPGADQARVARDPKTSGLSTRADNDARLTIMRR